MLRPDFVDIKNGEEFNQWYWLKEEMLEICVVLGLPTTGGKFTLRDRIMYALDNEGNLLPEAKKVKPTSKFNWAKEKLSLETVITDTVSFGPNFRRFMKSQIGSKFSCHSDFMDWVKDNEGKTLADAVLAWEELEKRKLDPLFKREIAEHNMLAQYVRDFLTENAQMQLEDALKCWNKKRLLPMKNGLVKYEVSDLAL